MQWIGSICGLRQYSDPSDFTAHIACHYSRVAGMHATHRPIKNRHPFGVPAISITDVDRADQKR
jgi:hypothetical protein